MLQIFGLCTENYRAINEIRRLNEKFKKGYLGCE